MTLAVLRALHAIIGDALDDIQRVYTGEQDDQARGTPSENSSDGAHTSYASPPPSPSTPGPPLDFPSLDTPYDPNDPAEQLTAHPAVVHAINRIIAAAGQMAITVQPPFYALCDASMGYHLPSCLRLLEASHTVEILREAGPDGLHVELISERNGVDSGKLAHVLRLLATHHFLRERSPNVFTINRISSLIGSGKTFEELKRWEREGRPEMKYRDTNGISAFVGMCTDELFKSSAYLTEAFLLAREDPPRPPFEHAFRTNAGFFAWLEGEGRADGIDGGGGGTALERAAGKGRDGEEKDEKLDGGRDVGNWNQFRLERFGTAMSGSVSWEAPGAVFSGFDWRSLPRGSIIVDVGGGIGSTSMLLANAFSRPGSNTASPLASPVLSSPGSRGDRGPADVADEDMGFKFIIQDRPVVVEMGEKAWRAKCPEFLSSGTAQFQVHDFFTEQPIKNAAVFFLRVILHDWPDAQARQILLRLREAATPETKLVLGDFVLPLACVDVDAAGESDTGAGVLEGVEGAESTLASAPLLANLGKSSANAYWMDLTMQVTFNSQERTLRETAALALSAGWKVVKVTHAPGSLFGHIVAVPVPIPMQRRARAGSGSTFFDVSAASKAGAKAGQPVDEGSRRGKAEMDVMERARSRCGTPTFGSRTELPSFQEARARFGGGIMRSGLMVKPSKPLVATRPGILKQPAVITPAASVPPGKKKKKPSPLSFPPPDASSPPPVSPQPLASPRVLASSRLSQPSSPIARRMSQAQSRLTPSQEKSLSPLPPIPKSPAPPSPLSPRHPHPAPSRTLARRASHAHLTHHASSHSVPVTIPPTPSLQPEYAPASPRQKTLSRTKSLAQLYQAARPQSGQSSSIPVRQSHEALPPHPQSPIPAASTPRRTTIARRSSYAQLPQTSLRTRSGSIIGPSINGAGIGGAISMASLLEGARGADGAGKALNFGGAVPRGEAEPKSKSNPGGSVLAAAARIEGGGGVLSRPTSP
ncbi:putative O-methyltransferase [Lyophyllum shimeji]|uniref:O-methyltransferase n=1 Tax=Lyophyllum shimeji TaxID=47721 RepID=A0A9P3PSH0_LYOSH|nr:putative O-methyltransferase [Lyophyllum shimeji]